MFWHLFSIEGQPHSSEPECIVNRHMAFVWERRGWEEEGPVFQLPPKVSLDCCKILLYLI